LDYPEVVMSVIRTVVLSLAASLLVGCAHNMTVKPDVEAVASVPAQARIAKNVGLYISQENRAKVVTSPGGGGDKVSYRPYADLETGLYKVLGNVFQNVTLLSSMSDVDAISKHSLMFVAAPEVTSTSSSSGIFTWMATDFTVGISCMITDVAGRPVVTVTASGTGHADSSEVMKDFSRAGERASLDALQKLQAELLRAPELRR
jgi:hypothetical protein